MLDIRNLEIHLVHTCNLACESCSHYSNQGHKGILSLEEADRWMGLWSPRLRPREFSLLGGEPTIHPQLPEFVQLARKHWPHSQLRLVTNGFFLHKHPELPAVLQRDRDSRLYLSVHHESDAYKEKLEPVIALLNSWIRDYGIKVQGYESFKHWTRRYHGAGDTMQPFADGQPRQSWEQCPAKYCPQIFNEQIWKCAPLAYLPMQAAKYRLAESWSPYLQYRPLDAHCSDEALREFFAREEEPTCGMCPARPQRLTLPLPLRAVA